jgi:hypothetical protein
MNKWWLAGIVTAIVLMAGLYWYLKENKLKALEPIIEARLSALVKKASDNLYSLEIETIKADIAKGIINLKNIHLVPNKEVYDKIVNSGNKIPDLYDITLETLLIENIKPAAFLNNKAIDLKSLYLNKPVIKLYTTSKTKKTTKNNTTDSLRKKIKLSAKDITSIKIDQLLVQQADISIINTAKPDKINRFQNIQLVLKDIKVDEAALNDSSRFLFSKECIARLKDYTLQTKDGLYNFKAEEVTLNSSANRVEAGKISFTPGVNKNDFYNKIKEQRDMFTITADSMAITGIDWYTLLQGEGIASSYIKINNATVDIFNDRSQTLSQDSKIGKSPHQLLMKAPMLLHADTVQLKNIDVVYHEYNPISKQEGKLTFLNANGYISNLYNDKVSLQKNSGCKVNVNTMLMGKVAMWAQFNFSLANAKRGLFSVQTTISSFDATILNKVAIPLGQVKIDSLQVDGLKYTMTGDDYSARGQVDLKYRGLKITALKKPGKNGERKAKTLFSFIANTFFLKDANPAPGKQPRVSNITYKRDPKKSFFNLIWKTLFSGAQEIAGLGNKKFK